MCGKPQKRSERDVPTRVGSPGTCTISAQVSVVAELHCEVSNEIRDVSDEIRDVDKKGTKRTLAQPRLPLESKAVGARGTGALRGT